MGTLGFMDYCTLKLDNYGKYHPLSKFDPSGCQGTASEATLVALLGAKAKMIRRVKEQHPDWTDYEIVSKLVGYCSGEGIFYIVTEQSLNNPSSSKGKENKTCF